MTDPALIASAQARVGRPYPGVGDVSTDYILVEWWRDAYAAAEAANAELRNARDTGILASEIDHSHAEDELSQRLAAAERRAAEAEAACEAMRGALAAVEGIVEGVKFGNVCGFDYACDVLAKVRAAITYNSKGTP